MMEITQYMDEIMGILLVAGTVVAVRLEFEYWKRNREC